ncbi:GNAT family N-acetyltransferase [Paenibacillus sp. OV219]|uniref:GNAT family N-acetyltransferase n=1 Tax=Paenibacillus sp. OV219 TaxID=1884377 RepID=UPI0008B26C78|nr:GNAT family N-acetyltransferase [Paenibacillus sp. OV219]SEM73003.1 Acetyltransferase (GNAT) family protein [Paenibacillus sp. OV219]
MNMNVVESIEELTMNAWPSLQTVTYGGWLLRFANGYTKRANSVHAMYGANRDEAESEAVLTARIEASEALYEREGQPAIFKLTPICPSLLDAELQKRNYAIADPSRVMLMESLEHVPVPHLSRIVVETALSNEWLARMCAFNEITEANKVNCANMIKQSKAKQAFFTLYDDDRPVACGLGALERGYLGLYDIVTNRSDRNRGYGAELILHMLAWARMNGATKSYLLVVGNNAPANRLYEKLNYKEVYRYWYRVQQNVGFI